MGIIECKRCSDCDDKECLLRGVQDFTDDHEEEMKTLFYSTWQPCVREMTTSVVEEMPILALAIEPLSVMLNSAFKFGYFKGRTYQEVPKVFEEA